MSYNHDQVVKLAKRYLALAEKYEFEKDASEKKQVDDMNTLVTLLEAGKTFKADDFDKRSIIVSCNSSLYWVINEKEIADMENLKYEKP